MSGGATRPKDNLHGTIDKAGKPQRCWLDFQIPGASRMMKPPRPHAKSRRIYCSTSLSSPASTDGGGFARSGYICSETRRTALVNPG